MSVHVHVCVLSYMDIFTIIYNRSHKYCLEVKFDDSKHHVVYTYIYTCSTHVNFDRSKCTSYILIFKKAYFPTK